MRNYLGKLSQWGERASLCRPAVKRYDRGTPGTGEAAAGAEEDVSMSLPFIPTSSASQYDFTDGPCHPMSPLNRTLSSSEPHASSAAAVAT